jgi:hypothetical protein
MFKVAVRRGVFAENATPAELPSVGITDALNADD